jgi:hypothetical protein
VGASPDAPTVTLTAAEYHAMRRREMLAAVTQRPPEHEAIAAESHGDATDAGGMRHRPGRLTWWRILDLRLLKTRRETDAER